MTNRTRPAALVAALCLLALTGCGGSSDGAKASSSPTPAALTAAQAKTVATASTLTAADLPGYVVATETDDADDVKNEAEFRTCLGLGGESYLASDPGRSFTKGDLEVDSSTDVAATVGAAMSELAAYTGPKASQCTKAQLTKIIAAEGGALTSFTLTPIVLTVPGSDGVFGYEMSVDASAGGQTIQLRGFETGVLVGQVQAGLTVLGTPAANLTVEEVQALLVKAVARAKAAL
jgi:hypothetical protein